MAQKFINNIDDLIRLFGFEEENEIYYDIIKLIDGACGFSVKRNYPSNIHYYVPRTKDGTPDVVCLFHIIYNYPKQNCEVEDPGKVPIAIRVSLSSKYVEDHLDYNFDDKDCPTEESLNLSKKTRIFRPRSLSLEDKYFFDHRSNLLKDHKGQEFNIFDILNLIFNEHIKSSKKRKLYFFRDLGKINPIKMIQKSRRALIKKEIEFLKWILSTIWGRTIIAKDEPFTIFKKKYHMDELRRLKTEKISILGCEASKNVIIFFCVLVFLTYLCCVIFSFYPKFLRNILKSNFLSIVFVIISIWILDYFIPNLILILLNFLLKQRLKLYKIK